MTEAQQTSFAAVITISLPNTAESATATITLNPADEIEAGGNRKRLGDCTLQELSQFAAELETAVWQTYQTITLLELVDVADIHISLPDGGEGSLSTDDLLDSTILLLPEPTLEPVEMPAVADTAVSAAPEPPDSPSPSESKPNWAEDTDSEPAAKPQPAPDLTQQKSPPSDESPPDSEPDDRAPANAEAETVGEPTPPIHIPPMRQLNRTAGSQLPEGHPTWMAVDILVDESPLQSMQVHALSSMHREVAGMLVGPRPEKQPDGRYLVHITDSIIAKHTVMQGASVTYTPESWRYIHDEMARRYPDETAVIVGWYHTHPGFGIFLSGMDQFIHQNFFTQIWHIALVLDPHAKSAGFFCWDRYQSRVANTDFNWPIWAQIWER